MNGMFIFETLEVAKLLFRLSRGRVRNHADEPSVNRSAESAAGLSVDAALRAYDSAHAEGVSMQRKADAAVGFGLAFVSAAMSLGLYQGIKEAFFFVPLASLSILLYMVLVYTIVLALGGYRRFLEERINEVLGRALLAWERSVAPDVSHGSATTTLSWVALGALPVGLTGFSLYKAHSVRDDWLFTFLAVCCAAMGLALAGALIQMLRAARHAYDKSVESWNARSRAYSG